MNSFRDKEQQLADLKQVKTAEKRTATKIHEHPKGWEPGFEWDGKKGVISTGPIEASTTPEGIWEELLADWGISPDVVGIVDGSVQVRGWDMNVGNGVIKRMRYYRATLIAKHTSKYRADVEELIREVAKKRPFKAPKETDVDRSLMVAIGDWQVGKGEGDGSAGSVDRILRSLDALVVRIKEFALLGRPIRTVYLCGLGDLVEQCSGHYAMQTFQVDLDRREQMKVIRQLILKYVDALLPLVERIVLVAVPGNHGENRNDSGKAFTTFTDNDDLAVFDGVSEIMAANAERYERVSVMIADELSTTVDMSGCIVGMAHMHAGQQGSNPQQKVENWWAGHALGRGNVHDADILITAHYHHLMVSESTGRTWFQIPAQDPGSAWFREGTGRHSPPGMFTVAVGECYGVRKWGDMAVL